MQRRNSALELPAPPLVVPFPQGFQELNRLLFLPLAEDLSRLSGVPARVVRRHPHHVPKNFPHRLPFRIFGWFRPPILSTRRLSARPNARPYAGRVLARRIRPVRF